MPVKKTYKRKVRKSMKRKTTNMKSLVRTVAKKVVSEQLEDKYVTRFSQSNGLPRYYNPMITGVGDIYSILPPIQQGTASNTRIGDSIRPKRLRVDFVISANGAVDSSWLLQCRLFVLQDKSIKNSTQLVPLTGIQPGTPVGTDLLDIGGGTIGFNGSPALMMARVNRQRYTVIKDIKKELINGDGLGPEATNSWAGAQVFVSGAQCHKFSVVIPTPAVLKYSQQTDEYPSNFAPFFVFGYVQPDGNALGDNIMGRVAVNYITHLDYEDA